ncbi:MAG: AAA family ATPase [Lactobacillales bacterium]|nr:AAA family ATPase [Lactobacillales bacterium]
MKLLKREKYLTFLKQMKNKPVIKVISGIRRSGKSTLFKLLQQEILNENKISNIISINFEQLEYEELCNYKKLHEYVLQHIKDGQKNYIFLDEIQHVLQFEKKVDSLFVRENNEERGVYLEGLFNTILLNDIVARKRISDVLILQKVIKMLISMIGNEVNINKIANTLRSKNIKITNQTLERWLEAILDSFVMYQVRKTGNESKAVCGG